VIAVTFIDGAWNKITVTHVSVETIWTRAHAQRLLYPRFGGSGNLSADAKGRVTKQLIAVMSLLLTVSNLQIGSICYGRGLMSLGAEEKFQQELETAAGSMIIWTPDVNHSMGDEML